MANARWVRPTLTEEDREADQRAHDDRGGRSALPNVRVDGALLAGHRVRATGYGPPGRRVGRRVLYERSDVEAFWTGLQSRDAK